MPETLTAVDLRTVLMTDIVGSTELQAALGDVGWRDLLLAHRGDVRTCLQRWRGFENDTAGDGFYITFADATDAIACAIDVVEAATSRGIQVRAGLHRGTCELAEDRCSGLTVSIGARVTSLAGGSDVLVTDAVRAVANDGRFEFADRGLHVLKGVPGCWQLYGASRAAPGAPGHAT